MDGRMFEGVFVMAAAALIAIPLAIWKLIDIIIWLCQHVSFGFQ